MDKINEIKSFLNKHDLLNKNTYFLVGFSGGADSLLLLHYLNKLKEKYDFGLTALHINHNWRGQESDNEAKKCEEFCKKNRIDFYYETLNKKIKHDENSARNARYEIFDKYAKKLNATAILTAHNSTDVVETFLYRLVKGMGVDGAMSIPEKRSAKYCDIYRPMINISSDDIRQICKELNLDYNIDSSNSDNKYKRNYIRNEILPALKNINKNYEKSVLSFIENIKSNNNILSDFCCEKESKIVFDNKIKTIEFVKISDDLKRIILHKYLKNNNIEPSKKIILDMQKQIEKNFDKPNGKKYSIKNSINNDDYSFYCSKKECYLIKKNSNSFEKKEFLKSFDTPIEIIKYNNQKIPNSVENIVVINKTAIEFPLTLRTRNQGDVIQPFSHTKMIKLKDYFIEKKVPEHKRDFVPLLCKGNEILWAVGVGLSEKLRANTDCKDACIMLKYFDKG